MDANADQAMPREVSPASGAAVWDLVLADFPGLPGWLRADIEERDAIGQKRYSQRLRVHNGRSALLDAYQEALDLWVYLTQSFHRALEATGAAEGRTAAAGRLCQGLAHRVGQARETVVWLGQLVHAGTELP